VRTVAVHESFEYDFIDHIAPMCAYLEAPYFFLDPRMFYLCKELYPDVKAQLVEPLDFYTLNPLNAFDTLLISQVIKKEDFKRRYPVLKSLFVPHGNSDKGHSNNDMQLFLEPDKVFIYGQKMIDYLKEKNAFAHNQPKILTGNYRLSYWLKHKTFYRDLLKKRELKEFEKNKKRALFAPTWDSIDGTFFNYIDNVIGALPKDWELIVKIHPFMLTHHFAKIEAIKAIYSHRRDILFLADLPLVFPLLDTVDIYIGDMSSIGYDFLYFDRPLYFLSNHGHQKFDLFSTGSVVNHERIHELFDKVLDDQVKFCQTRKDVFTHAFGDVLNYDETKRLIQDGLKSCSLYK
jgi:CDP-glycerol glycerophosphotransferase (TagB/SpsB family)